MSQHTIDMLKCNTLLASIPLSQLLSVAGNKVLQLTAEQLMTMTYADLTSMEATTSAEKSKSDAITNDLTVASISEGEIEPGDVAQPEENDGTGDGSDISKTNFNDASQNSETIQAQLNSAGTMKQWDNQLISNQQLPTNYITIIPTANSSRVLIITNNGHRCDVCGQTYKNSSLLNAHTQSHASGSVNCNICAVSFKTQQQLIKHTDGHMKCKTIQMCKLCHQHFSYRWNLKKHIINEHVKLSYQCLLCERRVRTLTGLTNHITAHIVGDKLSCIFCHVLFCNKVRLDQHVEVTHNISKCEDCGIGLNQPFIRSHHTNKDCPVLNSEAKAAVDTLLDGRLIDEIVQSFSATSNLNDKLKEKQLSDKPALFPRDNGMQYKIVQASHNVGVCTERDPPLFVTQTVCQICGKQCTKQQYQKHMRIHNIFDRQREWQLLQNSIVWIDGNVRYKCDVCDKIYSTFQTAGLRKHLFVHRNVKRVLLRKWNHALCSKCWTCKQSYNAEQMSRHGCEVRGEHMCELCEERFVSDVVKVTHFLESHGDFVTLCRSCPVCGQRYEAIKRLESHLATHNARAEPPAEPRRRFYKATEGTRCLGCKGLYTSKEIRHHGCKVIGQYTCGKCEDRFHTMTARRKHLTCVHSINIAPKFKCPTCSKGFYNAKDYSQHEFTHSSHKQAICSLCGKKLKSESSLKHHTAICKMNEAAKTETCDACGKQFRTHSALRHHVNDIHRSNRLCCEQCGKTFRASHHLRDHIASIHSAARPFRCSHCAQAFKLRTHLQAHERIHTGERPLKCPVCGDRFKEHAGLIRHRRTQHNIP